MPSWWGIGCLNLFVHCLRESPIVGLCTWCRWCCWRLFPHSWRNSAHNTSRSLRHRNLRPHPSAQNTRTEAGNILATNQSYYQTTTTCVHKEVVKAKAKPPFDLPTQPQPHPKPTFFCCFSASSQSLTYYGEAGPVRTIRGRAFRIRKISQLENTEENTGQLVVLLTTQLLLEDFPVSWIVINESLSSCSKQEIIEDHCGDLSRTTRRYSTLYSWGLGATAVTRTQTLTSSKMFIYWLSC